MSVPLHAVTVARSSRPVCKALVVFSDRAVSMPGEQWRRAGQRIEAYLEALGIASPAARKVLVARVLKETARDPAWATAERAAGEAMRCLRVMLAQRYWALAGEEAASLSTAEAAAAWQMMVWLRGRPEDILGQPFSITELPFRIGARGQARFSSMPPMQRAPMAPKRPRFFSLSWLSGLFGHGR